MAWVRSRDTEPVLRAAAGDIEARAEAQLVQRAENDLAVGGLAAESPRRHADDSLEMPAQVALVGEAELPGQPVEMHELVVTGGVATVLLTGWIAWRYTSLRTYTNDTARDCQREVTAA